MVGLLISAEFLMKHPSLTLRVETRGSFSRSMLLLILCFTLFNLELGKWIWSESFFVRSVSILKNSFLGGEMLSQNLRDGPIGTVLRIS